MRFFNHLVLMLALVAVPMLSFSQQEVDEFIVQEIKIMGNKTTKERIVLRELPFQLGDTLSKQELPKILERAQSNLMNTLLFNFVTLDPVHFDAKNISIYIMLEERWYWWPIPIFEIQETNFNTWWQTKDFERLNYGLYLAKENFRGRKEKLLFKFQGGYTEQVGIKYSVPYINKKQTSGMSVNFSYSRNHELTYATVGNVRQFYLNDNDYVVKRYGGGIAYEYRPKLYNLHALKLSYSSISIVDSVLGLNPDYLHNEATEMDYFSLSYGVKRDKRNFKSYPTKGYYYDLSLTQNGLGFTSSGLNRTAMVSQLRKYWQLGSRTYFSTSLKASVTLNEGPYALYGGLGYINNLVRGYELYVIQGEHYGLVKTQFRYALVDSKIFNINLIPSDKFKKIPLSIYLGAFFDAGYVDSKVFPELNPLTNEFLYGSGVAIDIVSYYDMVFRTEYAVNRLGDHGLFLHFVAPI